MGSGGCWGGWRGGSDGSETDPSEETKFHRGTLTFVEVHTEEGAFRVGVTWGGDKEVGNIEGTCTGTSDRFGPTRDAWKCVVPVQNSMMPEVNPRPWFAPQNNLW